MQGLYLVTDRTLCGAKRLEDVVMQAVRGGVSYVQLREKEISTRAFVEEALRIKKILAPRKVPLIINDRVDVALASNADGVHIGQEDMPYVTAPKLLGPRAIIGLSVETWDDVVAGEKLDVSYIGVSPVFSTPTKTDTKGAWGLEGLARIKAFSRHPLVAIGGIHEATIQDVVRSGARCVAVVSAICSSSDPEAAAGQLTRLINSALTSQ